MAFRILADNSDWKGFCAEGPKIVDGISSSAGNGLSFLVIQDQNRSLAGDSGNFSVHKHISDQVSEDHNPLSSKPVNESSKTVHASVPARMASTACWRVSATKWG